MTTYYDKMVSDLITYDEYHICEVSPNQQLKEYKGIVSKESIPNTDELLFNYQFIPTIYKVSATIGTISKGDLIGWVTKSLKTTSDNKDKRLELRIGDHIRVTKGNYKNLLSDILSIDGDKISISLPYENSIAFTPIELSKFDVTRVEESGCYQIDEDTCKLTDDNIIYIDLPNTVLRSIFLTPDLYNKKNTFIGGLYSIIPHIMKIKLMNPDARVSIIDYNSKELPIDDSYLFMKPYKKKSVTPFFLDQKKKALELAKTLDLGLVEIAGTMPSRIYSNIIHYLENSNHMNITLHTGNPLLRYLTSQTPKDLIISKNKRISCSHYNKKQSKKEMAANLHLSEKLYGIQNHNIFATYHSDSRHSERKYKKIRKPTNMPNSSELQAFFKDQGLPKYFEHASRYTRLIRGVYFNGA